MLPFDQIADHYDLINRLISLGQDLAWRDRLVSRVSGETQLRVLDLATGTGDQALAFLKMEIDVRWVVGLDTAPNMLELARKKIERAGACDTIRLTQGSATAIPFADALFDVVTISFGIRNLLAHLDEALAEMHRVLAPNGRVLILELSTPQNPIMRLGHTLYCRHIMPLIGGIVSGDLAAYRHLNRSVEQFPDSETFYRIMRSAGFAKVTAQSVFFGAATMYRAERAE